MKLPNDFDERPSGLTPTVVTAIVAVTLFVGAILVMVLLMNNQKPSNTNQIVQSTVETVEVDSGNRYPDTDEILTGSTLSPDDLDFWDKYPEETETAPIEETTEETEETVENDPSTDGKHTLVKTADGKEEWVLISPYLPKHEYDFTKLVCQSDLMKYYEDGRLVSFVGTDVSKYQDYIDFVKLKKAGIDFVMIRVGARGYGTGQLVLDEYFLDNIKRASDAGLEIGVYFFSQAITVEEAVEEANMVLENIKDYRITYPVAFDMEYIPNDTARIDNLSKSEKTEITKAFLDTIQAAGYKPMIYGNKEWLIKEVDMSKLTAYDVWLSQQEDIPDYPYKFSMWQYKTDATVDGIAGYADLNISFIDYSEK
uniref:glycoside hydrolase family 25 protein n=1 Tax=Acetatifactor sp. TaxID=1872090 RepID=UPI004055A782